MSLTCHTCDGEMNLPDENFDHDYCPYCLWREAETECTRLLGQVTGYKDDVFRAKAEQDRLTYAISIAQGALERVVVERGNLKLAGNSMARVAHAFAEQCTCEHLADTREPLAERVAGWCGLSDGLLPVRKETTCKTTNDTD